MPRWSPAEGDQVRVDIPDEADPDQALHGEHGRVKKTFKDEAGAATGDGRDSGIYHVELESGDVVGLQWRDIRPSIRE